METWLKVHKQRVMINGIEEVMATLVSLRSCLPSQSVCWKTQALPRAALAALPAAPR